MDDNREQDQQVRRQSRDALFTGCFKIPKHFIHLLNWCRGNNDIALNEQDFVFVDFNDLTDKDLEAFGLESTVIRRMRKNDVSFLTKDGKLIILVEHQTTLTPNLALKIFLYYMELVQLWIINHNISIHTESKQIEVPLPELYIAYNGKDEIKEKYTHFNLENQGVKIDVNVKIVDIRYDELGSETTDDALVGYSLFIKLYEDYQQQGFPRDEAFTKARMECMEKGYLKGFIEKEGFELYKKLFDYDEQLRAEGMEKKAIETAHKMLDDGLNIETIAKYVKMPIEWVENLAALNA